MKLTNLAFNAPIIPISTLMENFLSHAEHPTFQITDHAFLLLDQNPTITENIHTMAAMMEMLDPDALEAAVLRARKCLENESFSNDESDDIPSSQQLLMEIRAMKEQLHPDAFAEAFFRTQQRLEKEFFHDELDDKGDIEPDDDFPNESEDCTDEEDIVFETRLSAIFSEACEKAGICDQDLVMAAVDGALIIVPETTETEGEIPPGIFRLLQKHKIRPYTFAKVMHDIFEGTQDE